MVQQVKKYLIGCFFLAAFVAGTAYIYLIEPERYPVGLTTHLGDVTNEQFLELHEQCGEPIWVTRLDANVYLLRCGNSVWPSDNYTASNVPTPFY